MFQQLSTIILVLFLYPSIVPADRGDALLPLIRTEHLKAHITALQENTRQSSKRIYRTRSAYHRDASDNAASYIANQFRRSPRLKVEFETFGGFKNIVARLLPRATSKSNRVIILCAHYDTQSDRDAGWNPLTSLAPGANDNGTGVATMLEIAHLLSQFEYDHELRFIAFDAKEIGLMGSRHHARKAAQVGENIVAVFNIDMIGFNWVSELVEVVTNDSALWMSDELLLANKWYGVGLKMKRTRDESIDSSDHKSFWDKDYHAVTLVESSTPWRDSRGYEANPFYHTSHDTVDKINFRLVRKVAQLVLVTLNSLAGREFQEMTSAPSLTIHPQLVMRQDLPHITGSFESSFPIEIIVNPGNVTAQLDRLNHTYTVAVPLKPGENRIRATAVYPLGARSVEQIIKLDSGFVWESVIVFPNPSRQIDELTVFRAEGNLPLEKMSISIYSTDGLLVKEIQGVVDATNPRIWRAWWNHRVAFGIGVAPGIYVCRFKALVNQKTYLQTRKLAIIR